MRSALLCSEELLINELSYDFTSDVCENCYFNDIPQEKMSDCEYFARGSCLKDNCTYRHVNHNPDTKACEGFNNGFCAAGSRCKLRHVLFQQQDLTGNTKNRAAKPKYGIPCTASGTVIGSTSLCNSDPPLHLASVTASLAEGQPVLDDHISKKSRTDLEETDLFIPLPEDEDYPDSDIDSESESEGEGWDSDDEEGDQQQVVELDRENKESGSLCDNNISSTGDTVNASLDPEALRRGEDNMRVSEELRCAGILQFFPSVVLSSAMQWM